ncbi:hypothetical protein [Desulfobulbus rhabdoformis]|uniref:hypothetical protein n=1 Tax=Desulfobulbus rhabdoformis TaxID=34032 RepID=UPI001F0683AA|nr:hypothetical protein [Desulfobulbus rhabdoformis]
MDTTLLPRDIKEALTEEKEGHWSIFYVNSPLNLLRGEKQAFKRNITIMKKIFTHPIDLSKVDTLIYHLPDGPTFSVEMDGMADFLDFEMELGDICDTSDIDGVVHFFPRGNA